MLSLEGMLNGLTATLVVVFASGFSIFFYLKARKLNAKLLKYGAAMGLFAGLLWLGPTCDFITYLLTETHIDYQINATYGILSYMWVGPAFVFAMLVGTEVMIPNKKKPVIWFSIIFSIIFEIILFTDRLNTFRFSVAPGDLIDSRFVYFSPAFIMIAVILIFIVMLNGIGSIQKAKQTTGEIRKNFLYLALAFNLFVGVAIVDAFLAAGPLLYIARLGMIICALSMYLALKG